MISVDTRVYHATIPTENFFVFGTAMTMESETFSIETPTGTGIRIIRTDPVEAESPNIQEILATGEIPEEDVAKLFRNDVMKFLTKLVATERAE